MSQLVVPKYTACSSITTSRRITEIMQEKGKYYSQQAMASRLGYQRTTFRKMLNGTRDIYTFELEQIARDLKVSPERLLQRDVQTYVGALQACLLELKDLEYALEVAEKYYDVSSGITEKCDASIYLGRVLFELKRYAESHTYRLMAHQLAEEIYQIYGEADRYHQTVRNLMVSFTVNKDFHNAKVLVDKVMPIFEQSPAAYGALNYTLAMIAYHNGDFQETRIRLIESLKSYEQTGDAKEIAKALHRVAFIEFKLGHLSEAKEQFERSISMLDQFPEQMHVAIKDYVKVLHKLGEFEKAEILIHQALHRIEDFSNAVLKCQFLILRALCCDDPVSARDVLAMEEIPDNYKTFACEFLMNYYNRRDDAPSLMKYYKIAQSMPLKKHEYLQEEDL